MRKKLIFAVLLLTLLCLSEVALLLLAVGALPAPTDRRLVAAASDFARDPNAQTELDLYKESARLERREGNIGRVSSLIAVLNTVALMSALSQVKKLRALRRNSQSKNEGVDT
jgi:hypothetical protein